jgi:ribosomal protein S18 acetylase RimI-like enzyme
VATTRNVLFNTAFADTITGIYIQNLHHTTSGVSNNNIFLRQMEGYDIVTAKEEDRESIAEFLRQHFFKYEPLNVCTGCSPNRPISAISPLRFLSQGKSLLAVSRNGRHILGVCVNAEVKRNENTYTTKQMRLAEPSYNKISSFLEKVEASADIWKDADAHHAILMYMLGVDPAAARRGIARALMETSRDKARSEGYQLTWIVCTSHFSAKIARSIGMECVYSLPYSAYKDEDGNPVFKPPHPHTEVAVFVQKLSSAT